MGKVVFYTEDHVETITDRLIDAKRQIETLERRIESLESLRPHWAQGYTSDSIAAQAKTAALSEVWGLLGVDNQTDCMQRLRALLQVAA